MTNIPDPRQIAREHWGDAMPEWIAALADECAKSSQNKVAKALDVSATMISQALRAKYPGDLSRLEAMFTGLFQSAEVPCPAKGVIAAHVCRQWRDRSKALVSVNTERVQMFRACNKCPRNAKAGEAEA